jgi:glycosyltransferase involved in cell wall biosynthesis
MLRGSLAAKRKYFIYSTKINKSKDVDYLIEAVRKIGILHSSIRAIIIICGNSPYVKYINDIITEINLNNIICFTGYQH